MATDADARTLAFYDANACKYSKRKPRSEDIKALKDFMAQMPEHAKVCDLGCGNGWASAELAKNGYSVKSVDGSRGLALRAKQMYGLDVEVKNFDELAFVKEFDGVWACWSLHHVSQESFPSTLQHVAKFVCPGGLLFFSTKGGASENRDGNDRLYARHERAALSAITEQVVNGTIIRHSSWTVKEENGDDSLRHQVFVRIALSP